MTFTIETALAKKRDTIALGEKLARLLREGDIILLSGDLGAGKSTLARAIIASFCAVKDAPSPTFTFVETYEGSFTLWHFDLYRMEKPDDLWELGWEEALEAGAVLVEWPERLGPYKPENALTIRLDIKGKKRRATFMAGKDWKKRLAAAGID